ncbi:hypothetical protein [Limnobaculum parvum]|uniref:hypothetical protein n=1 Tax=Limnobaculum parvum TaxID=2172103 RepID=UPI001300B7DB|nr:hypothetical protein [Limnobaculum parvum]
MIAFVIHLFVTKLDEYFYRSAFIEHKKREWQSWGRLSIPVLAYAQYTPVENITDKILGISGRLPLNPNAVMKLNEVPANSFSQYSLSFVFNKLIEPMVENIKPIQHQLKIHVYSSESVEMTRASLQQTFEWFRLSGVVKENIHYLDDVPSFETVYTLREDDPSYNHLAIMVSLHNDSESKNTESAVSLLFGSTLNKTKSDIYFFRPIKIEKSQIDQGVEVFLEVEQIKGNEAIHLWMVNVDDASSHSFTKLVGNSTHNYTISGIHSMNSCFGKVSAIYAWNSIVCAAEAIKAKNQNSLITLQQDNHIESVQVARSPGETLFASVYEMSLIHSYYLMGVMMFSLAAVSFISTYGGVENFLPWLVGGVFLLFIFSTISVIFHHTQFRKTCQREWDFAQRSNELYPNDW